MKLGHLTVLLVGVLLAGCAPTVNGTPATQSTTNSPLPPRPRSLPLDQLAPCTILTTQQIGLLGVGKGKQATGTSSDGSATSVCQWARFPQEPQDFYTVGLELGRGAEYALGSTTGARVIDIDGFSAVESQRTDAPPDSHCLLAVDVAAGQNLGIRYDYDGSTVPMTRQLACEKAATIARMAVQTLIEQNGG